MRRNPVGRPKSKGEIAEVRKSVKFTPSDSARLEAIKEETGVPVATFIKQAVNAALAQREYDDDNPPPDTAIPLLGEIAAGPAMSISPFPDGVYINPPGALPENCYALLVRGDSMESAFGLSIPDGYYAIFCPDVVFPHAIVHVEFSGDDGESTVTLKKYFPRGDGVVEFRPLNDKHKPIVRQEGEFNIKGGFSRTWDGKSGE